MFPVLITVSYAPESTLDENFDTTELENVKVLIDSEASIKMSTLDINLSRTSYVYEGTAAEPTIKIEGLKEGTDYTVACENNTEVGTAKAIVKGMGDYAGTVEKEFTITQANIANAEIAEIADIVKTGEAVEPELKLTFNGQNLEKGKDYEVSYADNIEVGTATANVKGIGNFKGTIEVKFNITETAESKLAEAEKKLAEAVEAQKKAEAELEASKEALKKAETKAEEEALAREAAEAEVTAAKAAQATAEAEADTAKAAQTEAEAKAAKAEAAQKELQEELNKAKTDKEAAEAQAAVEKAAKETAQAQVEAAKAAQKTAEAEAQAAVKAKEAAELQEENAKAKLTQAEAELEVAKKAKAEAEAGAEANAQAKAEAEKALAEAKEAKAAAEAELKEVEKAKKDAEAKLTQAEKDKQTAEEEITKLTKEKEEAEKRAEEAEKKLSEVTGGSGEEPKPEEPVVKTSIAGATVSGITTKNYTGKAQKPVPTVKVNGKTLQANTDYTVGYKNNTNVGKATVTISGTGDYTGTITKTFTINPKSTSISKVTKGKKSFKVSWKKVSSQASGYQIQYATNSKFTKSKKTVTIKSYKSTSKTVKKLKAKKKYYVKVRTYKKVGNVTYYSGWSKYKTVKTK